MKFYVVHICLNCTLHTSNFRHKRVSRVESCRVYKVINSKEWHGGNEQKSRSYISSVTPIFQNYIFKKGSLLTFQFTEISCRRPLKYPTEDVVAVTTSVHIPVVDSHFLPPSSLPTAVDLIVLGPLLLSKISAHLPSPSLLNILIHNPVYVNPYSYPAPFFQDISPSPASSLSTILSTPHSPTNCITGTINASERPKQRCLMDGPK